MAIPTKKSVQDQDAARAAAQQKTRLTDALTDAINRRDYSPQILGHFSDELIRDVAAEFASAGWTVTKTGQSRSYTNFSIK